MLEILDTFSITEKIITGLGVTGGISLICWCRKIIASWLKRRINRTRHLLRPHQSFPRHTLQFARLVRQQRQLILRNKRLHAEIAQLNLQFSQKNKQTGDDQLAVLLFAAKQQAFTAAQVAHSIKWNPQFTELIISQCLQAQTIRAAYNYLRPTLYSLTNHGRAFLLEQGLLPRR
ncbi:Hypothetical protein PYTT_2392 [Akkermansia glycaniphila]|uniref:Uncharacterized protein n=1 Tax=Akkermansia glycaniphila TaxID=1679444 RepID=A0A1C7P9Z6_9BACT|nr:hypothetical protein [Akkermansia glycaniphila]OCA02184.1 hypothetical protein AC781_11535 [Akkermansia glycaniphila]SEH99431.1 Hypothetical protein PYTT_2392 [Akkermansia glycaniphila]